jgi:hypothetical protein
MLAMRCNSRNPDTCSTLMIIVDCFEYKMLVLQVNYNLKVEPKRQESTNEKQRVVCCKQNQCIRILGI